MKKERIQNFKLGWVIGNFQPTLLKTQFFIVSQHPYKQGDIIAINRALI